MTKEKQKTPKRPAVRYHGGKWRMAEKIIKFFPKHRVYVEPFGGGGSVLLRKARTYAEVYNDLDGEMVNYFQVLRDHAEELERVIRLTPFSRAEFERAYTPSPLPVEQARRTLIKAFMGFGSAAITQVCASSEANKPSKPSTGFRSNSNRSGTTPAHDWRNWPDNIEPLHDRLKGVVIENRDAVAVMLQHDSKDTLHYCDPPYVWGTRAQTKNAGQTQRRYRHEMTDDQHVAFCEGVRGLEGMVVISGYESELYDQHLPGWQKETFGTHADNASDRTEVLWLNSAAVARLQPKLFDAE